MAKKVHKRALHVLRAPCHKVRGSDQAQELEPTIPQPCHSQGCWGWAALGFGNTMLRFECGLLKELKWVKQQESRQISVGNLPGRQFPEPTYFASERSSKQSPLHAAVYFHQTDIFLEV